MGMCASKCSICGISLEDNAGVCLIGYWWIENRAVCKECAKKLPGRCPVCGDYKGWCSHKEDKKNGKK